LLSFIKVNNLTAVAAFSEPEMYPVIDSRRRRRGGGDEESESEAGSPTDTRTKASLFAEKKSKGKRSAAKSAQNKPRLSKEELIQLDQQKEGEALRAYARVKQLWDAMLAGEEAAEREWLIEAEKLVEMFRETRALFSVLNVGKSCLLTSGCFLRLYAVKSVKLSSLYRLRRLRQDHEAEEDSMASRLQLELGIASLYCRLTVETDYAARSRGFASEV
jgi:general transcription factor 3C polypeptide 3 (transcription factor C subunit 4)